MTLSEKFTKAFEMTDSKSLADYNAILNNPSCTIIKEVREKVTEKHFEDGKVIASNDRLLLVVTWQEKKLL